MNTHHLENHKINSISLLSCRGGHWHAENLNNLITITQLVRRKLRPESRILKQAHRQPSLWVHRWKDTWVISFESVIV